MMNIFGETGWIVWTAACSDIEHRSRSCGLRSTIGELSWARVEANACFARCHGMPYETARDSTVAAQRVAIARRSATGRQGCDAAHARAPLTVSAKEGSRRPISTSTNSASTLQDGNRGSIALHGGRTCV